MDDIQWARNLARGVLDVHLPDLWAHTQGVAKVAESIAGLFDEDYAETLICAAWLHDIGYSIECDRLDFHPLDAARYLRDLADADYLLCRLIANHSCAIVEAEKRGLANQLAAEFPPARGLLSDALTYCDMTTSPQGQRVDLETRFAEIQERYGKGSIVAESMEHARPEIERSVRVVEAALAARNPQRYPGRRPPSR